MDAPYQNINIRMPNWLGDAVMATPVIADVRHAFPNANITAMCQGGGIGALLWGNPHVDEIFTFIRPQEFLHRFEHRDVIARLRQGKYDLGILLTNSFTSAWWFWRGQVRKRLGFATHGRTLLLNQSVAVPEEKGKEHLVNTYKRLLLPLEIPLSKTAPQLFVSSEEKGAAQQLLASYKIPKGGILVGINPGAAYGSAKCWLPDRFRALIEKLAQRENTYVLCFADAAGAELVHGICQGMPSNVIDLAGATHLRELIALIQICNVFLTNDSGPMHIAAALKTPLVALFGSTSDVATGPYEHGTVIHKHVSCSPCFQRVCPIDFRCMKRIEVDEVYSALLQYLP